MHMEDDIDALLDDVEAKYCEQMCQRPSAPTAEYVHAASFAR